MPLGKKEDFIVIKKVHFNKNEQQKRSKRQKEGKN